MKNTFKKPLTKILLFSTITAVAVIACKKNDSIPTNESAQSVKSKTLNTQGLPLDNQHIITLEEANQIIGRFKNSYPNLRSTSYFTATAVRNVLNQEGLNRVKFYFGSNILNQPELFMLGLNSNDDDMINGYIISSLFVNLSGNSIITQLLSWTDNQLINLNLAAASTARHRNNLPEVNIGASFTQDAVRALVIDEAVAGVRVDLGLNNENKWTLVLRAVDSNGDIYVEAIIIDMASLCPPTCGTNNILNSN